MNVSFYNDGATIRVVYSDGRTVNLDKPYLVSVADDFISIRNELWGDRFHYSDVIVPSSTSIDDLRSTLETWLESANSAESSGDLVRFSRENADISGQVGVGTPTPLGDYRFTYNLNTRYFNTKTNGTGAITHDTTNKSARIEVSANNDWAIISTYQSHPYYAGFPIGFEFTTINFQAETGVEKFVVYGDRTFSAYTGLDGIQLIARDGTHYIEIWNAGTKLAEYPRSGWADPMDGTGPSKINLGTFSTFCVFSIQWLWLGGAGVALFAYANGRKYLMAIIPWSYTKSTIIISNPQKPLQAGMKSTGGSGHFNFICSTVKTLGTPSTEVGETRSISGGATPITLAGSPNNTALIGLRLKSSFRNANLEPISLSLIPGTSNDIFRWKLILNPTVAGTFNYSNAVADDSFEYAIGATTNTVTGGTEILAGESFSGIPFYQIIKTTRLLGFSLSGVADTLILCAQPLTSGVSINASMNIKQRY